MSPKPTENPAALLLVTGALIGLNFPLGKVAGESGVSPVLWAGLISLGAALTLLPVLAARGRLRRPSGVMLRYAFISGMISFVAANLLVFTVIPYVGSGFTGLMFALSPVFTLALSALFGLRVPNSLGLLGIGTAFFGAAVVAMSRQSSDGGVSPLWLLAALAIPATLAAGNVYRTVAWPKQASPDELAFWSHAISVAIYASLLLAIGAPLAPVTDVPATAMIQFAVAGLTFPAFFRLQRHGGPVLLSQIGYVAAAVGLAAATLFLGEVYPAATWAGAAVVATGIVLTILSQRDPAPRQAALAPGVNRP